MTKHTAGILGSFSAEALRSMTDVELQAKADAIEATNDGDGMISTSDEADLCLINREQERRENEAEAPTPAGWYLATCREVRGYAPPELFLIQAKAGAEIEDALKSYGRTSPEWGIRWKPLADLRYGIVENARVTVIPAATR